MHHAMMRKCAMFLLAIFGFTAVSLAQTVTGTVTDKKGEPIPGVTVTVKGTKTATSTNNQGVYSLSNVASDAVLQFSGAGISRQEVPVSGRSSVNAELETSVSSLNEVVVVGYGTSRKKDLTGSVASVKSKDFIQGALATPDQLIQGKVAGVQITNNSGAPGGEVTVRIRGNNSVRAGNQPLVVVDGVPLDGRAARPGLDGPGGGLGDLPGGNPLQFLNAADIASIDVLKDASAAAIYGSRGANGVILVTTKRGQTGTPKVDLNVQVGVSNVMRRIKTLDGPTYLKALEKYGQNVAQNNYGGNVDAFDEITRTGIYQNYTAAISGGNENGRYRASFGYFDQQGIVRKSGLKKITANISGQMKFLESKKLGLDFSIIASQLNEQMAPVTNTSGFQGSLIGQALQWNPTRALRLPGGALNITGQQGEPVFPNSNYNPLAMSESYDDRVKSTNALLSISPYYKITKDLEYRILMSANYSTGIRRSQIARWMNLENLVGRGFGAYGNSELLTKQITHTLNYNKQLNSKLSLGATLGYEYMSFENKGMRIRALDFAGGSINYTDYLQYSSQGNRNISSFNDPLSEIQSYFGRFNFNVEDKYLVTLTMRADGSSKFGANNKYGYFPAIGAAWNLHNENFLRNSKNISSLKLRLGWGKTGNQEFPAGAAQDRYRSESEGAIRLVNAANPDLKWETSTTINAGLDFGLFDNKLTGSVEYFRRKTSDLLFELDVAAPGPAAKIWSNLDGEVINAGFEMALDFKAVSTKNFQLNLNVNAAFLSNKLQNYTGPILQTGEINGQGLTGARAQQFVNGYPLSTFFMGRFLGIDKNNGQQLYEGGDANANRFLMGSANPTKLIGFSASAVYKKLTFTANMNGAFGHYIYNNTLQAALAVGNIRNKRNIAQSVYDAEIQEDPSNAQPVSDRYLEKGNYMKLANATVSYNLGNIGKNFINVTLSLTGANLFVITKYSGFDPEVNTPKTVEGVPSFGIEYTPYPSARSFIFGLNCSF
jgi:iron complex outermembrane receptor protein